MCIVEPMMHGTGFLNFIGRFVLAGPDEGEPPDEVQEARAVHQQLGHLGVVVVGLAEVTVGADLRRALAADGVRHVGREGDLALEARIFQGAVGLGEHGMGGVTEQRHPPVMAVSRGPTPGTTSAVETKA